MASVIRDEVIGCSNPKLDLFTKVSGSAVDIATLEWAITDLDDNPIEPSGGGRNTVDPSVDCPTGPRIGTGHYAASWTVPSAAVYGDYKITWWFKLTTGSVEQSFTEEFVISPVVMGSSGSYATVQDFRDEGFTVSQVSDARLTTLIAMMSKRIDDLTGQWFEPRQGTMTLDGRDSRALRFPVPVISVSEVRIDGTVVDSTAYRVYNRHLNDPLQAVDDRNDPRIVMYREEGNLPITLWSSGNFPAGKQNIQVDGVWGYTDGPGSPGITPLAIKEALMLMVIPKMPLMSNKGARTRDRIASMIMREETRDQRVELNPKMMQASTWGYTLTGDPEVDSLLIQFMAPISIGDTGGAGDVARMFERRI